MRRWAHRGRGTVIAAVVICLVGLPLIPLFAWLAQHPPGGYPYVRWPGRDGAHTLDSFAFFVVLGVAVFTGFALYFTLVTAIGGPANRVWRAVAVTILGAATVTLFFDWVYLFNYVINLGYLANPD